MLKNKDRVVVNANETANTQEKKHNILPKILSVVMAFILWFYVVTVESPINEEVFKGVPINVIVPTSNDLSAYSGYNATLDITVSGKKSELNQISAEDFKVTADASSYNTAGRYSVPVHVELPENVTLVDKSINVLSVYLDLKTTVSIPVKVKLTEYILDDGLELAGESEIEKSVSEITVSGPKSILDNIESAVATVPLGHVSTSMSASVDLELLKNDGSVETSPYVTKSVDSVDVKVPVFTSGDLSLGVEFKNGYLNSDNCKVKLDPSHIKVRASIDLLSGLDKYIISTIDEKAITTDKISIPLTLPEGFVSGDSVESVEVTITHIGTSTKTVSADNFDIKNPQKLKYSLNSDSLNVTLRGKDSLINSITAQDITLTVDLSGQKQGSGTVTLPVTVTVADTYSDSVYELGEYRIAVTIE